MSYGCYELNGCWVDGWAVKLEFNGSEFLTLVDT